MTYQPQGSHLSNGLSIWWKVNKLVVHSFDVNPMNISTVITKAGKSIAFVI